MAVFILLALGLALCIVLLIFCSRRLSPIPYFPSNKIDKDMIIKSIATYDASTIVDLGAGDGWVIFEVANHAVGVVDLYALETNPILLALLHIKRSLHPRRANIHIVRADIFTCDYSTILPNLQNVLFYVYISPWTMDRVLSNVERQLNQYTLISYFYPVEGRLPSKTRQGANMLYEYASPSRPAKTFIAQQDNIDHPDEIISQTRHL